MLLFVLLAVNTTVIDRINQARLGRTTSLQLTVVHWPCPYPYPALSHFKILPGLLQTIKCFILIFHFKENNSISIYNSFLLDQS